jgi:hypothetical protein
MGAWIWPPPTATSASLLRALILLLVFLGLLALKQTTYWNVILLVLFGIIVGSFAGLFSAEKGHLIWCYSTGIASTLIFACFVISQKLRKHLREIGTGLWLLTWFYVFGWVGLSLLDLDPVFQIVWATFGLALFVGMGVVWFSNTELALERLPGSALGVDLYLIMLNMILASRFLLYSISL